MPWTSSNLAANKGHQSVIQLRFPALALHVSSFPAAYDDGKHVLPRTVASRPEYRKRAHGTV